VKKKNNKKNKFKFTVFYNIIMGKLSYSDYIKWLRLTGQWKQKNPFYFGEPYKFIGERLVSRKGTLINFGINLKIKKLFFYEDLKLLKYKIFTKLKLVWYFCDFILKKLISFKILHKKQICFGFKKIFYFKKWLYYLRRYSVLWNKFFNFMFKKMKKKKK